MTPLKTGKRSVKGGIFTSPFTVSENYVKINQFNCTVGKQHGTSYWQRQQLSLET